MTSTDDCSVAKGLKLHFILVFTLAVENKYLLQNFSFGHNVSLRNPVTFDVLFTLEFAMSW